MLWTKYFSIISMSYCDKNIVTLGLSHTQSHNFKYIVKITIGRGIKKNGCLDLLNVLRIGLNLK